MIFVDSYRFLLGIIHIQKANGGFYTRGSRLHFDVSKVDVAENNLKALGLKNGKTEM